MAYENVDTTKLRAALNDCLNSLDYKLSNTVIDGLTDSVWSGQAKTNLTSALAKLIDEYKEAESKINAYLSVANEIESYQNTSDTISNLESSKAQKERELKLEKKKSPVNTSKVNTLQNEINSLNNQISQQNSKLNSVSVNV